MGNPRLVQLISKEVTLMKKPFSRGILQVALFSGILLHSPGVSFSQELISEPVLPLSLAQKAANAAREKCEADGYKVSVAIVDSGGNLKVLVKGDGAGPHATDSSFKKAYTALTLRRSTMDFSKSAEATPALKSLEKINDKIILLAGGLPIKAGDITIGGIGVGGAPGGHLDDACAKEGLEALKPSLSKKEK